MENKKPWYEKLHIWISIVGLILGGVASIFEFINNVKQDSQPKATVTPDVTLVANIQKEKVQTPPTNIKTPNPSKDIIFGSSTDGIYEQSSEWVGEQEISEKHTESISGTNVKISKWNQEDLDIVGNNYNNGDKITISNYSYTSDSKIENKVKSTITIPKSTKTAEYYRNNTFTGTFVLEKV